MTALRRIYRYSVIPGGVVSADELRGARRMDSIVAAHYADFKPSLTVGPLPRDMYFYVSYRKSDKVYWTAQKRRIPKGERVLSDSKHLARTRCGNRLSPVPMSPTLPGQEPPEADLNAPEPPPDFTSPATGAGILFSPGNLNAGLPVPLDESFGPAGNLDLPPVVAASAILPGGISSTSFGPPPFGGAGFPPGATGGVFVPGALPPSPASPTAPIVHLPVSEMNTFGVCLMGLVLLGVGGTLQGRQRFHSRSKANNTTHRKSR